MNGGVPPMFSDMPEGQKVMRQCDACERRNVPICIRAMEVLRRFDNDGNPIANPTQRLPAIVMQVTRTPPTLRRIVKTEAGDQVMDVRNPDHNPTDMVIVATWELRVDLCLDHDCFLNQMDKFWAMGTKRIADLWGTKGK